MVGAELEGKGVITAGRKRQRDLLAAFVATGTVVVMKTGSGTSGSCFKEVLGTVELNLGN